MKQILYCILLLLTVNQGVAQAALLTQVTKIVNKDIVQFYFGFDVAPQFTSFNSDRRIDVEFIRTTRAPSVSLGKPDNDIVKILPRVAKDKLIVSFFFRYRPQHHKVTLSGDGKVVFEVLLGNEYSKSYQQLADRLKGLTVLERTTADATNPLQISPYARNWPSFFSRYEAPVSLKVPVRFSNPPFPLIGLLPPGGQDNLKLLSPEVLQLAGQNLWTELAAKLLLAMKEVQEVETRKLLALTYGEALGRSGNFDAAYRQLYLLKEQYHDEILGTYAEYLLTHLRSVYDDPFIADEQYQRLEPSISDNLPLAPYFHLSQMETALASADYERLNHLLLRDDIAVPPQLVEQVQIRQADYWSAIHQPIKALAAYQVLGYPPELQSMPFSLNNVCSLYYDHNRLHEADGCFTTLATLVTDKPLQGLVEYKKIMTELKMNKGNETALLRQLSGLAATYPHTEAGYRASMKSNDLLFLKNRTWGLQAVENYRKIAEEATDRPIREEAMFKQALVKALLGDSSGSIELLQQFLREFLTGDVRISAQALLIDLLPAEIKRLVDQGEYIKPLVLAKQNKDLFQNHWIDSTFLLDVAEAYSQIGIYDEAHKLYLYLIGIMPPGQKEDLYPPLLQAAFNHGDFPLVEDYAAQYTYEYPHGRHTEEILFYRLQALIADERLQEALQLLPEPLPDKKSAYELAISLFFRTDNFQKCVEACRKLAKLKDSLSEREQFLFAESLYRTEQFAEAATAFMKISPQSQYYANSLFRLAELARQQHNEEKALSFFGKLAETANNSLWKQYAVRELQFAKATAREQQ